MNKILMVIVIILSASLLIALYYNFTLSFKLNHCKDNMFLINEDLNNLGSILRSKEIKIDDFENLSDNLTDSFQKEENIIRFQIISVTFDENGNIQNLSF